MENVENSSDHKDSEHEFCNDQVANCAGSSSDDLPFCCYKCSQSFSDTCDLTQHMSLHFNEVSFGEQIDFGDKQIEESKSIIQKKSN